MKKSTMVTLVLSSRLVAGCDDNPAIGDWSTQGASATNTVTNNTYVAGRGYYHAPYYRWYEYPYNFYRPGFGYYHGGFYTRDPEVSAITVSRPMASARSFGSKMGTSSRGITRGGFGFTGHAGS